MTALRTVFDKIWDSHSVHVQQDGTTILYIDRHLIHEVTSAQAFEGLKNAHRKVLHPKATLAVADHNVPTINRAQGIKDPQAKLQIETLEKNCKNNDITFLSMEDERQGVVHIIGPEQGFTLPGTTIVCGDSHTATHGAFGALAFGIGTSEVEHVLATSTLLQKRPLNMRVTVRGKLGAGITAKDIILAIIGKIGTAGGTGHVIEFTGDAITSLSMESRMTLCNMAIEAGARAGMVAPDQKTFDYLENLPMAPKGELFLQAVSYWKTLSSDPGATYDSEVVLDAQELIPQVTWGTSPEDVLPITGEIPNPENAADETTQQSLQRKLDYMGLTPGQKIDTVAIDRVFIGSCTNGRIEDLRAAAEILKNKTIHPNVSVLVVPGSGLVKKQAESEGLDKIFQEAGCEWREPGCSMCLAMNDDKLKPLERCASTSNRNFEGRQGRDSRTHLLSPIMAAAAAIEGHLTDVRKYL